MPWTFVSWLEARAACDRVGKRLCEPAEWQAACGGPMRYDSPYGPEMIPGYCNERAAWDGTGPEPTVGPTGSWPRCEGGYPGLFDMAGNVREWSNGYRPAMPDGGARVVVLGDSAVSDGYVGGTCRVEVEPDGLPDWGGEDNGFRCCSTP